MILFINACVRDDSRTLRLAKDFLASYGRDESITAVELQRQGLSPLDGEKLSAREKFIAQGNYDNEMFEHDFGYPMINADGTINGNQLLLDLYIYQLLF